MSDQRHDLWTTTRTPARGTDGAHAAGPAAPTPPGRRRGWLWLLIALVAVAALLLGISRCGADGTTWAGAPTVPAAPAPDAPAPAADAPDAWTAQAGVPNAGAPDGAGPGAGLAPGALLAGSMSLFDAVRPGGPGLAPLVGQTASGRAVPVQSVPADEGFWIGTSTSDRVWVQLSTSEESAVQIVPGQLLDLSGPVVSHGADFAGKAGVPAQDGAEQLTRQAAHLEVDPNQVKVVGQV
jgi:hypothetical protein